jgi:hypothetical protein
MVHDNRLVLLNLDIDRSRMILVEEDSDEIYRKIIDNYSVHFQSEEFDRLTKSFQLNIRFRFI